MALAGRRLWLRLLFNVALGLTIPVAAFYGLGRPTSKALPAQGSITAQDTDIVVEPHSTFWAMTQPKVAGELIARLAPGDAELGLHVRLLDDAGVTREHEEAAQDQAVPVGLGAIHEMIRPVLADGRYAVFVVNETDARAKARLTISLRWGKR
jgi:hypothetical protein